MRVYLAALLHNGYHYVDDLAEDRRSLGLLCRQYPWKLLSYHYVNKRDAPAFREIGDSVFLDSGAFTMYTKGIDINLQAYADFIEANKDWVHVASNLDAIGAGREAETYANQKTLEKMGAQICPVHHARDDDRWLLKYIDEGYDWIFLGGMVPESTPYLRRWLDRLFDKYLTHPDGTAKVKVHGFGMTTLDLVVRYPWYSIDSTSWLMASNFGGVYVDLPHTDLNITISSDSSKVHQLDGHYATLAPLQRDAVRARIEELGFVPEALASSHFARRSWNIKFFERFMQRANPIFLRRYDHSLFDE